MMSICKHGQLARSCTVCDELADARNHWLEEAAKVCETDVMLCPADEKYDNEEARQVGEGTAYNMAAKSCAAAIRAMKTEGE